jgi:hypothetical protein
MAATRMRDKIILTLAQEYRKIVLAVGEAYTSKTALTSSGFQAGVVDKSINRGYDLSQETIILKCPVGTKKRIDTLIQAGETKTAVWLRALDLLEHGHYQVHNRTNEATSADESQRPQDLLKRLAVIEQLACLTASKVFTADEMALYASCQETLQRVGSGADPFAAAASTNCKTPSPQDPTTDPKKPAALPLTAYQRPSPSVLPPSDLLALILQYRHQGLTYQQVADTLNEQKIKTTQGNFWSKDSVRYWVKKPPLVEDK